MSDFLVDCAVRLVINDQFGRYFMMVRGNEWARSGRRHLMLGGGGVKASPQGAAAFRRQLGVTLRLDHHENPNNGPDIRFSYDMTLEYQNLIREFVTTPAYLESDPAGRELMEEFHDERAWLTKEQVLNSKFYYHSNPIEFEGPSIRSKTPGAPTLYFTYLCKVTLPDDALLTLLNGERDEEFMGEFVTAEEISAGWSARGR